MSVGDSGGQWGPVEDSGVSGGYLPAPESASPSQVWCSIAPASPPYVSALPL